ncbi:hypothetical protein POM88_029764 [Heracleum sosnowskyi]|uniref:DUF4218 domain-containing protein n=1 Tax=Heracleum sosnowskyi TaxID=360622 RepID=A0AAD8HVN2_9APIA|nr:hypothetical protein POM88_029764 [Heracleum sosnowskyi]
MDDEEITWTELPKFSDGYISSVLHPVKSSDGQYLEIRAVIFDMTNKEKEIFCSVLEKAKLPYRCAANISRYVHMKERTIWGYKSHDAHFLLHYLLQFAVKKTLKPEVAVPLIRLGVLLRSLWSKVIDLAELNRLEKEIVEIICHFEMIFLTAFFDIMIHLLVHLCKEIELGGPAHLRCMWPIERYLCKLKSYVRNNSKPEGSIAEGYLAEECLTFCSRFLNSDAVPKFEPCHRYILFNYGNKDVENLIEEHRALIDSAIQYRKNIKERGHTQKTSRSALKQKPKSTEAEMPKSANVRRKLDLHNPRDEGEDIDGDENMDENDIEDEDLPPPPPLESSPVKPMTQTQYEMIKLLNIQRNNEKLKELNLPTLVVDLTNQMKKDKGKIKGKRKVQDKDEYVQENEEQSDDGASEILLKKTKNVKNKLLIGPTTRSRANGVTTTEKGSTLDDTNEEATNSVLVEHPAKTQLPCIQVIGSMADYLAMRKLRQKKPVEAVATGSGTKTDKVPETDLPDIENEEAEADPEVQARPEKNSRSRREYTDTHTAGPQLFSQIRHNMDTINKKLLSAEGLDGLDELVSDGKKLHGPGWFIGRHDVKCVKASTQNIAPPAPTDSYIQELTKKLRWEVVEEVEEKLNQKVSEEVDAKVNQKVQDNLTLVLKKLVDANPSLNINIGEIYATISSDTGGDGTPMTNIPSS